MSKRVRHDDHIAEALLFISGDSADATRIIAALSHHTDLPLERARTLSEGLARLTQPGVTSILLSLALPDSAGLATFQRTAEAAGSIPILVLCGADDESTGELAVEHGADDFLLADHFDRYSLTRAVASLREHATI